MTDLAHIVPPLRDLAVALEELCEDPANARAHDERNLQAIAASLKAYGQRKPIVVRREGMVVEAGNGTLAAARAMGWTHLAAVVVDDDALTATGFAIADNRSAELAEWDDAVLSRLLEELRDQDVDLEGVGFSDAELDEMLAGLDEGGQPDAPDAEEPPAEPVSEEGEIYALGPHRLLCGDSTDAETVARLLGGAEPRLMVTDPPYGVDYDASWRQRAGLTTGGRMGRVENDDRADWSEAWALFPGAVAYVWHAYRTSPVVHASLVAADLEPRVEVVWAKSRLVISQGHYHPQHESCWYAVRKGGTAQWLGDRSQTTLWQIELDANLGGEVQHSTQKPLECMERPIRNHAGDVYDPFLGSGTTLIAAARQGRVCYGVEISPAYCDVIRKRWGDYARANGLDPGPDAL